jgi:SAM-dependent methyltransferase
MSEEGEFAPNFAEICASGNRSSLEEYGRFQQHLVLLEDRGRVARYNAALDQLSPGGVVVDVGSGTGVLGLLALKKGFEHAFLIEPSRKMAAYARHLAHANGYGECVTILEQALEHVDLDRLPAQIDLVVSETLSSLLFGFGSWDSLPSLVQRVTRGGHIIPSAGRLYVAATSSSFATRGPDSDGLALLRSVGLQMDLFERTFRSGGNVYDKATVIRAIQDRTLIPIELARFDVTLPELIRFDRAVLDSTATAYATGLMLFWEVELAPDVKMTNLDPVVTSWYPLYVPLRRPVQLPAVVELRLLPIDAPYKYAFQFESEGEAISHVLYW